MALDARISVRSAGPADESALWLMLTYAASMDAGGAGQIARAQADPYLRGYVDDWCRRDGDLGSVAVDCESQVVGAAWLRYMAHDGGLAVGSETVPELATGVLPEFRGRGIGRRVLTALIAEAAARYPEIVLTVREDNRAASFYRTLGFVEQRRIVNRVGGASLVMALRLAPDA